MTREEAIKKIKKSWDFLGNNEKEILETLIPELKESEDEKVKKIITLCLEECVHSDIIRDYEKDDAIAWLEKQKSTPPKWKYKKDNTPLLRDSIILNKYGCVAKSPSGAIVSDVWVLDYGELAKLPKEEIEKQDEQKHADNIELKFNVGDWVTNKLGESWHIDRINNKNYQVSDGKGNYNWFPISKQDEMNLWTIADAKEGDVLTSGDVIFIFNMIHGVWVNCQCSLHKDGSFNEGDYDLMHIKYGKDVYPATKEQRDTLFAAMKAEGYEWDADKPELKKRRVITENLI